jgi:hypothetical protein
MQKNNVIKIPSEAILDLSTDNIRVHSTNESGDVIVFLDKIAYMRNTAQGTGLLRMVTGVDINVNKEWYEKVAQAVV